MKQFLFYMVLSGLSVLLAGCLGDDAGDFYDFEAQLEADIEIIDNYLLENGIDAVEDSSGIRYIIQDSGEGEPITLDKKIALTFEIIDLETGESLGIDTVGQVRNLLTSVLPAWQIILPKINAGGSVTIYSPSGYAYGPRSTVVRPNANLIFELMPFAVIDDAAEQVLIESEIIDDYLTEKGIPRNVDASGIRYRFLNSSAGESPNSGSAVRVKYTGTFLSTGAVFDQNNEGVVLSLSSLIEAWRIMLPQMSEGEKIQIFSPSRYAYGENGAGSIPPNAILVFEIDLLEVL